jgi:GntR family transcriptional regulator
LVPRLEALAAQYGVARITVRQAMDLLDNEGLVTRVRGRGTHVLKLPPAVRWVHLRAEWDEFIWPTATAYTRVLVDEPARHLPEVAPHEGTLKGPYRLLKVVTYRSTDGPPISLRTTYLRESVYLAVKGRLQSSLYIALLAEHVQRLTVFDEIASASGPVAATLGIPPGSPVVEARHVAVDAEGAVAYVDYPIVRGEFVKFEISIERPGP